MPEVNRRKFLIASAGVGALGVAGGVGAITCRELLDAGLKSARAIARSAASWSSSPFTAATTVSAPWSRWPTAPTTTPVQTLPMRRRNCWRLDAEYGTQPRLEGIGEPMARPTHWQSFAESDIPTRIVVISAPWTSGRPHPLPRRWVPDGSDGGWTPRVMTRCARSTSDPVIDTDGRSARSRLRPRFRIHFHPSGQGLAQDTHGALAAEDPPDTQAMSGVCASYRASNRSRQCISTGDEGSAPGAPTTTATDANRWPTTSIWSPRAFGPTCRRRCTWWICSAFDTHADERGTQQSLLQKVDDALTPFVQKMRDEQRRARTSSSWSTRNSGAAWRPTPPRAPTTGRRDRCSSCGQRTVKGGFYGDEPSLTDLDDGDLKTTPTSATSTTELLSNDAGHRPGAGRWAWAGGTSGSSVGPESGIGTPDGIRTHATAVRGRRPRPLDDGG